MTATFKAYGIPAMNYGHFHASPDRPLEHVFVLTDAGHDWGCFGRGGAAISHSRLLTESVGNARWANLANGTDKDHPTGMTNFVDGTCHCVANRLLAFSNSDVSAANGNELVILGYGKYGYGLDAFVERVKDAAVHLRGEGVFIGDEEVAQIEQKLRGHIREELDILRKDFEELFPLKIGALATEKLAGLRSIYERYHTRRLEVRASIDPTAPQSEVQTQYRTLLHPALIKCLYDAMDLLGQDVYTKLLKLSPPEAARFLFGR